MQTEGESRVIVLDGGMGDELRVRSPGVNWSPLSIQTHADTIVECHCDYIKAGARVIETWNYSATPFWIRGQDGWADKTEAEVMALWEELTRSSVRLAKASIEKCKAPSVRIAGALPPLLSTYNTDDRLPEGDMLKLYTLLAKTLLDEGVDLLLVETCACVEYAAVALEACQTVSAEAEVWVSFTLQDKNPLLWSGESVEYAVATLCHGGDGSSAKSLATPAAIMFNCSPPEVISAALALLRPIFSGKIGAYGNRLGLRKSYGVDEARKQTEELEAMGIIIDATDATGSPRAGGHWRKREDLGPNEYLAWCVDWVMLGADIVGGCCGIGPEYIEAVADSV